MSIKVEVRNNNLTGALTHFKSRVQRAGILDEYKERQHFTKPSEKRIEKLKRAKYRSKSNG
jgi:small subunit ribosomal protein S21